MVSRLKDFIFYDPPRNGNNCDFDATALFERSLVDYPFDEFLDIAKHHSEGRIWIIGGFVYRNIIKEHYGTPYEKRPIDIDFLVEEYAEDITRPKGWELGSTSVGDLSFSKGDEYEIALNGLVNFHSITSRDFPEEIQSFYSGTPLNIQSISYDCEERVVEGEFGIDAIERRVIEVNYIKEAQWEAERISKKIGKPFSVNDLIRRKADELRFEYKLPW